MCSLSCLNLWFGKFSAIVTSNISSAHFLFFLLLVFQLWCIRYILWNCPRVLVLFFFPPFLSLFAFQLRSFYRPVFMLLLILSLAMFSLLMSLSWTFFISVTAFYISSIFWLCFTFNKNCIYLKSTTWWFDTRVHSEMITIVKLINLLSPHLVFNHFLCDERTWNLLSSKFPVFSTVLFTAVFMLEIRSLDLFIFHNCNFVPFDLTPSHFPHLPVLGNSCSTLCS